MGSGAWGPPPSGRIRLWDWGQASHQQPQTYGLAGPPGEVSAVAFSPDGRLLAYRDPGWNAAERLRVWDLAAGRDQVEITGQFTQVSTAVFSPDGRLLATGDGHPAGSQAWAHVRVWEVATGRRQAQLGEPTGYLTALAFSPDGRYVAAGDHGCAGSFRDGRVRVWEWASGRQVAELGGHTDGVLTVAFSRDGGLLASTDHAGVTRIWTTPFYTLVATLVAFPHGWAVLLPDGSYKLAGDPHGRLWWAMKLCRLERDDLDDLAPILRRMDSDALIPGLEHYRYPSDPSQPSGRA
jgi:WD40 repeat protein